MSTFLFDTESTATNKGVVSLPEIDWWKSRDLFLNAGSQFDCVSWKTRISTVSWVSPKEKVADSEEAIQQVLFVRSIYLVTAHATSFAFHSIIWTIYEMFMLVLWFIIHSKAYNLFIWTRIWMFYALLGLIWYQFNIMKMLRITVQEDFS